MVGNTLSILHWEHMGVGVVLSQALNNMGIKSRVISRSPHPFDFKADHIFPYRRILNDKNDWFSLKINRLSKSTIFHNHSNYKVSKKFSKHWKGRFIQHYHDPNTEKPIYDTPSFVSTPTLLGIIPDSTWIPFPVHAIQFREPFARQKHDKLIVGFCAQEIDPHKKALIPHRELAKIADEDKRIAIHPLKKIIPHNQMHYYYSKLDVWVDRIIDDDEKGFYGFAASECAMMGIPIITKIDEQTLTHTDSCPFINILDRSKLATELKSLAEDEKQRRNLSRKTRDYALKTHDSLKVAGECLEVYRELKL